MPKQIQFIFVRHGQSQANATGRVNDSNSPLTELGIEQARKTAVAFRDFGFTKIVHSPLLRAKQTAQIIAQELGLDGHQISILDELRERGLGRLEGKVIDRSPLLYYSDESEVLDFESRRALYGRMKVCLGLLRKIAVQEKTLVVGHSISGYYLLQVAAKKTLSEGFTAPPDMSNASYINVKI